MATGATVFLIVTYVKDVELVTMFGVGRRIVLICVKSNRYRHRPGGHNRSSACEPDDKMNFLPTSIRFLFRGPDV
jgi:hypothetical protein